MSYFFKLIYKKILVFFFRFLYGKIYLSKNFLVKKIQSNKELKKNKYFIYFINKGRIYTDNTQNVAVICKNNLIKECSFQHKNNRLVGAIHNPVLKYGTPRFIKKFNGTVFSLVQGASGENYFHWLMDILPKIKICLEYYSIKKIDYFYTAKLNNAQTESLKYLGIDHNKIINSRSFKHIKADTIITTSHPWYRRGGFHAQSDQLPKWSINWIRKKFLHFKKRFKVNDKIFLDRLDSTHKHCQIINYEEIKKILKKNNFQIVQCSKFSFAKQIYMFWKAKFIIGVHGAALTNIIFCKPKTKILEIKPYKHPGKYYKRIAKIRKLNYKIIQSEKKYTRNLLGDIFIEPNKFRKIIKNKY